MKGEVDVMLKGVGDKDTIDAVKRVLEMVHMLKCSLLCYSFLYTVLLLFPVY